MCNRGDHSAEICLNKSMKEKGPCATQRTSLPRLHTCYKMKRDLSVDEYCVFIRVTRLYGYATKIYFMLLKICNRVTE